MRVNLWNDDARPTSASSPVQGWGWFGPWSPGEFPFNAINYQLGAIARDRR